MKNTFSFMFLPIGLCTYSSSNAQVRLDTLSFEPSESFTGIKFLGFKSGFQFGDTWYPSWASNDTLYSPWTDGTSLRMDGYMDEAKSWDGMST